MQLPAMNFRAEARAKIAYALVRRICGRSERSTSSPTRTTRGNRASTSASDVRKFTMQFVEITLRFFVGGIQIGRNVAECGDAERLGERFERGITPDPLEERSGQAG